MFTDTKRRAREEASRKVLRKLADGISCLDVDAVFRLTLKFKGANAILDASITAPSGITLGTAGYEPMQSKAPEQSRMVELRQQQQPLSSSMTTGMNQTFS